MRGRGSDSTPLLGAVGGLVAVACCAGLPLVATIVGGLTLAAVLGVAGGAVLAACALAAALLLLRSRRRRRECATSRLTR